MDYSNFSNAIQQKVSQLESYFNNQGLVTVKREVYRFLDDNFRLQGWQGTSLQPWKANKKGTTILVKSGQLKRGFNSDTSPGLVRFYNNMPYAQVHNEGFKGTVNVSARTRAILGKVQVNDINTRRSKKVTTVIGESQIKAYNRRMDIDQRQFAPYEGHESQILNDAIIKAIEQDLTNMFKSW